LLERQEAELTETIEEALRPGSGAYDTKPDHFELLAAHAASQHASIRQDVAVALGSTTVGVENAPHAVTLLISLLDDRVADVRRLAALSLGHWRGEARAAESALEGLRKDPVKAVAQTATRALEEISWKPASR
jgi:HEAT repeats